MNILTVRYKTNQDCLEALDNTPGQLFCPTTQEMEIDETVVVELSAPAMPNKLLVRGTVLDWRPALPRRRIRAGATVSFADDERSKIEFLRSVITGEITDVAKRRHTRLPISISVRYRLDGDADWTDCSMVELSQGGGLLETEAQIANDASVLVEMQFPGAATPVTLSARVAYHSGEQTGVRFDTRDQAGVRRLRELVRRVRNAG